MHGIAFIQFALHALQNAGDSLPGTGREFSQPAAALALTALWQGAAVALGLDLCLRLAPRSPARHRFALWAAGFGAIVALQILPFISRLIPFKLQAVAGSALPAALSAAAPHPWLQLSASWSVLIASLWLAASLYRAADLALHSLSLRRLWKSATPVEIDTASLPRSSSRILRRTLQICTTSELERPSVIGFFAPRILIPDWLFSRLTPGELDQIVLHETEHLRRRDDWTNLLQKLCLVLFPLNPGLAWIERRLCREREMACDDGVIHITRAPRAYAACLTSLAERGLQRRAGALSLGAWHARPELVRRVHSILRRKHALNPLAARAVVGAVGCALIAGATALARCPRLIAFVPAHSASAAHISPIQKMTAFKRHDNAAEAVAAWERHSPAEEFSALQEHGFRSSAMNPHGQRFVTGHDFSRAANASTGSRALAPEGKSSRALARATPVIAGRKALALEDVNASRVAHVATDASDSVAPQFTSAATGDTALRPVPVIAPAHQSAFIVMSAWESVEIPNSKTSQKVSADKCAQRHDVRVSGTTGASAAQQLSPRISLTRMYLKIYTGDRESAWLVIQL
ncbi:MAG TPA: M56 family metallopeptidase [Terracidiphilus sp.]|nr:M56 family metallopeptidase [Terracidiphilus sp.]